MMLERPWENLVQMPYCAGRKLGPKGMSLRVSGRTGPKIQTTVLPLGPKNKSTSLAVKVQMKRWGLCEREGEVVNIDK